MATLKIYGDIGEPDQFMQMFGIEDSSVSSSIVAKFLEENTDSEITVRINSRGGDVQEGWAIYDLLMNSGKKIKTIGEGKVYSIATVIFLAGSERQMMQNADGLIHNPWIPTEALGHGAESGDLLKIAEGLAQEEEKILNLYAEKTGHDRAKLAEYMKNETKLSAQDMLTLGFATSIVEPIKAYAIYKLKINNMDEKAFFEKLGATLDNAVAKIAGFSRLPISAMELTDMNGNVLKVEKETGTPAVGDKATPDGEFTMADGSKIVVSGGVITEMEVPVVETELDKANKEIERMKSELAKAAEEKAAYDAEKTALETEKNEVNTLITDLRAIKNEWKPDARNTTKRADPVTGIDTEKVKEVLEAINKYKK